MSENWTQEAEPEVRGTVTKTVPPAPPTPPPVSDDKLKAGIAALGKAAHNARQDTEAKVEAVRRSLAPTLKEAATLKAAFESLDAVYRPRLEELRQVARSSDLRRYHGIDDALARLFDITSGTLTLLSSGLRCLSQLPQRVSRLEWNDIQTKRYLDIPDVVKGLRDVPERIPRQVRECERMLDSINAKIAGQRPTRQLIEADDPTYDPRRSNQTKADNSSWNPFEGTPRGEGTPEPFAL